MNKEHRTIKKGLVRTSKKGGFTLVETLVAITILMISIAGPMVIVGNGIRASQYVRDQVTAFYLAQDAVEALRFLRDNDRIAIVNDVQDDWQFFTDIAGECSSGNYCGIDTLRVYNGDVYGSAINIIDQGLADDPITQNGDGYYGYGGTTDTKFMRSFTFNFVEDTDGNEIEITVKIDWSSNQTDRVYRSCIYH
jgi:type II secretory pathway pseudopilin PulG